MPSDDAQRFKRQTRFAPLGVDGQGRIQAARVLVSGCGGLGSSIAQQMTRAGVGGLVLVDRDVAELSNLPRQVLLEDRHAEGGTPKAVAAIEALERIGGPTRIEAQVAVVDAGSLPRLAEGCDLILDGNDNMKTRYAIDDYCVERGLPWVYGGVVGSSGLVLPILPGRGPCLRCLFPHPPPRGSLPTSATHGILMPAVGAIASLQVGAALRILAGETLEGWEPALIEVDVWQGSVRRMKLAPQPDCRCRKARTRG